MFWSRKEKVRPPEPKGNRLDALANRLQKEGRIQELEAGLASFDPLQLEGAEKESWYHLRGIVAFQQGNRHLAFERFQEGVLRCPESDHLHFSLGQEHEFRGEPDLMVQCFDKARFPKIPANYALAQARYSYLWNRLDRGWEYLEVFLPFYFKLKILDSTFLHMRGLPFFEQVWAYLAAFSSLEGNFEKLRSLTRKAESECGELDFESLKAELEGIESGDFSRLKEILQSTLRESEAQKWPSGYSSMRLQVLKAQGSASEEEADRMLDSVVLGESDFPWLSDIRLLARCEQARRFGSTTKEDGLQAQFLARQPLLFEPDHAVNFNLLSYQERLKEGYRKKRQGG